MLRVIIIFCGIISNTTKAKLRDKNRDMYLLQETHSCKKHSKIWRNKWGREIYFSHESTNSKGVCKLIKPRTKFKITNIIRDFEG